MSFQFDHIVHCVRNLDQAAHTYEQMGFTLTPTAHHPFGTKNRLAMMSDNFIELLAIGEERAIPVATPGSFSFGDYNRRFLRAGEGLSMLAFQGPDRRTASGAFETAGGRTYRPFEFSRDAQLPDGSTARLTFVLNFFTHASAPDAVLFTSAQLHPREWFWKAEYQRHGNGALRFQEVVLAAADPAHARDFLEGVTGDSAELTDGAVSVGAAGHRLTVLTPQQLALRFPGAPAGANFSSPRIAACAVRVESLEPLVRRLAKLNIPHRMAGGRIVVAPGDAHGAILEFAAS